MTVKLIALDLDGTALNDKKRISERTKAALEAAAQRGVRIVIATGRPFTALPQDVFDIPAIRYVITSNGAQITDLEEDEVIYTNCLSQRAAEASAALLKDYPYVIEAFTKGTAYIEEEYYRYVERTGDCFRSADYVLRTRNPVQDIYQFVLDHKDAIENINVNFDDIRDKADMIPVLLTIPEATITSSFSNNLEIGGETTSKADALTQMSRILGIHKDEMMAVGDSPNDIAMIKAAGLSIAMGNGEEEVKEAADHVTLSNAEDGVAAAIEKFVLAT